MVVAWTLSANPSDNYLECNGQVVDSTKYPKLYALMHNVPDYRGMFLRGLGGNSASLGVTQGDAIRNIIGTSGYFYSHGFRSSYTGAISFSSTITQKVRNVDGDPKIFDTFKFDASRVVPTAEENRPVNKAVRYFIKSK